jgi:hypothetical protein
MLPNRINKMKKIHLTKFDQIFLFLDDEIELFFLRCFEDENEGVVTFKTR